MTHAGPERAGRRWPGALVGAVRSQGELEALPLVEPEMVTPVGFIYLAKARASRALEAALGLARDERWQL